MCRITVLTYRKGSLHPVVTLRAADTARVNVWSVLAADPAAVPAHDLHHHVVVVRHLVLLLTGHCRRPDAAGRGIERGGAPNPPRRPGRRQGQGGGRGGGGVTGSLLLLHAEVYGRGGGQGGLDGGGRGEVEGGGGGQVQGGEIIRALGSDQQASA